KENGEVTIAHRFNFGGRCSYYMNSGVITTTLKRARGELRQNHLGSLRFAWYCSLRILARYVGLRCSPGMLENKEEGCPKRFFVYCFL
ncbi:hypothetical protein, partial [Alteromonas antoniana]|uniref:hypothetical protein n=1 Tax=Alteromonas antoniana TaxID=2803813 RepID=UPI001C44C570